MTRSKQHSIGATAQSVTAPGRGFRFAGFEMCSRAWREHQARLQRYNQARRRRFTQPEAGNIERLHRSGQTLAEIGAKLGINRNIIRRELREHGIVLTAHNGAAKRRMTLFDAEVEKINTMLAQGRNMTFIAEEIRVDERVIRRELRAKGLPTRPERRRRGVKKSIDGWWGTLGDDPDSIKD